MTRIRSFYDADKTEDFEKATTHKTAQNSHEVLCDSCGERFFVGETQAKHIKEAFETTRENVFICDGCQSEYEDLAHGA